MAEAIPYGAVANILSKLASSAFHEISSVSDVENDMRKLVETLTTIKDALEDIDQKQEKEQLVRAWIKKLNGVVYAADDVLDAFCTKALQREVGRDLKTRVREFFSSSNRFGYTMSQEIKEIRERFDKISEDMGNCSLMTTTKRDINGARVIHEERKTHSFVLMSDVIGREKEIKVIVELLMCSSNKKENVNVIPIVGMGGVGKTTLAKSVYCHERVVKYFELRIWVCVSEEFETKTLVRNMLKSITSDDVEDLELYQLKNRLGKELDEKRYLLILDDVWNENYRKWEEVKKLLMGGAKGSSIVVTTRSQKVASVMSVEEPPYVLEGLSEENSRTLFKKVASRGDEKDDSKFEVIREEIVKRCKGVPLAIRTLAVVMRETKDESEWLSIKDDILSLREDDDAILHILRLSYDHLPTPLRQCFTYCSIFPKGYVFEAEELIQLWMAQGYIQSPSGSQDLEDIGGNYFGELLSRSFFRADEHKEVIRYTMIDLMQDLAVSVAGSDCLIAKTDEDDIFEKVHHVSLEKSLSKFPTQLLKAKGLRTMFHTNFGHKREIASIMLSSKYRRLRVLKVQGIWGLPSEVFTVVPHSIGKLQHLRYLDLSESDMKSLPNSIGNLVNLQTLKLSDCGRLERLPRGITKLIRLRYLVFDGCWELYHMPTGLRKLTYLRKVSEYMVGKEQGSLQLSELKGLNQLRGELRITGLENASSESNAAILIEKQFLHSLTLEWGRSNRIGDDEILLESLKPHSQLKELSIINYPGNKFPNWMVDNMVSSLQNIVRLTLLGCDSCQHLSPLLLDQLPLLETLGLSRLHGVKHIDDDNNNLARKSSSSLFFPSLTELFIGEMPNLEGWWRSAGRVVADCLTSSSITTAAEEVAQYHFSRLTKLDIYDCPSLTFIPMTPNLEELRLTKVGEKLVHQLLTTKTTASVSASSSSSRPSKLRVLDISYVEDLECLTKEAVRNLSSLERLSISGCPRLSRFTTVSEVVEEEEWFRGLTHLKIVSCESLTSLSPLETQKLTALQTLSIVNCQKFYSSGDDGVRWEGLTSLRELQFKEIPKLVSLPLGLKHVTTLQDLRISKCHGLMALPEWLRDLKSLRKLKISFCPSLSERCRAGTGEDWPNISHVPNIVIDGKRIQGSFMKRIRGSYWKRIRGSNFM